MYNTAPGRSTAACTSLPVPPGYRGIPAAPDPMESYILNLPERQADAGRMGPRNDFIITDSTQKLHSDNQMQFSVNEMQKPKNGPT